MAEVRLDDAASTKSGLPNSLLSQRGRHRACMVVLQSEARREGNWTTGGRNSNTGKRRRGGRDGRGYSARERSEKGVLGTR